MTSNEHPYSAAFVAGDTIYVSGALSVDPDGHAVAGRREALDAAVARLSDRLGTADAGLADVVKATYFVTDVTLREEANQQFLEVFADPRPARSFIGVSALPYGASVEIEAVAQLPPKGTAASLSRKTAAVLESQGSPRALARPSDGQRAGGG